MRVLAELVVELHALEVLLHEEVDDPGYRIGPIGRRGAAGQHFDAFHEGARDLVDVGADAALQG